MNSGDDLAQFVKESLIAGKPRGEIRSVLAASGWSAGEIEGALASYSETVFIPPVPRPRLRLTAWDGFVYLSLFTALVISARYLITLIFAILDFHLPDPTDHAYVASGALNEIRWAIATLLVSVPVFVWITSYTGKRIDQDAGHKRSLVRKWVTYLGLFVSAIVVLGDATYVIYSFLMGEATLRYLMKASTVGFITAAIFFFFLRGLEDFQDD